MNKFLFFLGILVLSQQVFSQSSPSEQREKMRLIMRLQDLRTVHDGKLISLLSDSDPVVRERAVRAFGSIQDTSVLSLLVQALSDEDNNVRYAAAFAIGQTGGLLSKENKQTLEHDLIWARADLLTSSNIHRPNVLDRLIEEIGKFGTLNALNDIMLRFDNTSSAVSSQALIMSIARFAIRNVKSETAVQFLLKFITPAQNTPWEVTYALQRIGDHKLIRGQLNTIALLDKHRDPLVRMNLATLLGKIKDEYGSLEHLNKLALYDEDWRVRVNALKALGNFNMHRRDESIDVFQRSFFDQNQYIALTAIGTFGNLPLQDIDSSAKARETIASLEAIVKEEGYPWQVRGEAATALAKLKGTDALPFLRINDHMSPLHRAQILRALGESGAAHAAASLLENLGSDIPAVYCAALDGLQALSTKNKNDAAILGKTYDAAVAALSGNDVAVVTTATAILSDSLFLRPASVAPLLEKLSHLRVPDDIEAMQEIISALGKLKHTDAVPALTEQLHQHDRSVAIAAAAALASITGKEYLSSLPASFEPLWTDYDFGYLDSLKDNGCVQFSRHDTICVKLETIRGDIMLELYKNYAPFTVMTFLKLATQKGFYRGRSFHRVVPNFVIQGGDPRGDGWGGPGFSIRSEFSPLTYETGMLGVASAGKDTEGSQFFITQSPQPHLDGRYTIFGKVVSGMEAVNKIQVDDHMFDVKLP